MFVAQSQPMKKVCTVEVMQTAQRQVGSEAGVCKMFNEKQVGQGGWSEKGVSGRRVQALDITPKEAGSHQRVPNRRAT